jgi:hypothetical protein
LGHLHAANMAVYPLFHHADFHHELHDSVRPSEFLPRTPPNTHTACWY